MAILDETFRYLFEAEDMASGVVSQAEAAVAQSAQGIEDALGSTTTAVDDFSESLAFIGEGIDHTFEGIETTTRSMASTLSEKFIDIAGTVEDYAGVIVDAMRPVGTALMGTVKWLFSSRREVAAVTTSVGKMKDASDAARGSIDRTNATTSVWLRSLKAVAGAGAGGVKAGVGGAASLLGGGLGLALGAILKLLSPIIEALTGAFQPAMEILGAAIKNAFAPFEYVLTLIAQSLAPVIQEFLAPFVNYLTIAAVQVGVFLQGFLNGNKAAGGALSIFSRLQPVFSKVFEAVRGLAERILPVIGHLFDRLLPVVVRLVETFANALVPVFDKLGGIVETLGPMLVDLFVDTLEAVIPLIEPLTKLGVMLLEKVFAPGLILTVQAISAAVRDYLVPGVNALVPIIDQTTASVNDFFSNFKKYTSDFYTIFIKPIVDGFQSMYDSVRPLIEQISAFVGSLVDSLKEVATGLGLIGGPTEEEEAQTSAAGAGLAAAQAESVMGGIPAAERNQVFDAYLRNKRGNESFEEYLKRHKPGMQRGGIVTRPMDITVGEGGFPEGVIPLTRDAIERFVAPVVANMDLPGLGEAVVYLKEIARAIGRPLAVRPILPDTRGDDDLRSAVGLGGLGG